MESSLQTPSPTCNPAPDPLHTPLEQGGSLEGSRLHDSYRWTVYARQNKSTYNLFELYFGHMYALSARRFADDLGMLTYSICLRKRDLKREPVKITCTHVV